MLLLGALVAGCRPDGASEAKTSSASPSEAVHLKVVKVAMRDWPRTVRVQGSLVADERAVVGAKVGGRVKDVNVDLGSVVRKGMILVGLDTADLDLKIKQAQAQLEEALAKLGLASGDDEQKLDHRKVPSVMQEQALRDEAKANLDRILSLVEQGAVSREELQQRQAALDVAEARLHSALNGVDQQLALVGVRRAELAIARQIREDSDVRAPLDGVVELRHVAPGTYLQVGQPVVALVRTNPLRFHVGVPEREAPQIRLDQVMKIKLESHEELEGRVTRISPALEMSNRSLAVEVDVPNPNARLQAGLFAEGEIIVDPHARTLAVPASAVNEFAGVEKVWLVKDGKAAPQIVLTGRRTETWIEILRGVEAEDLVAVSAREGRLGPVVAELSAAEKPK
jgi:RND family efflux transporter MFP subunit